MKALKEGGEGAKKAPVPEGEEGFLEINCKIRPQPARLAFVPAHF